MMSKERPSTRFAESRHNLKWRLDCKFVDADEFCSLAISTRKLLRLDQPADEIRALFDPATGETFMIEEEKLFTGPNKTGTGASPSR